MHAGKARCGTDTHSLKQEGDDLRGALSRDVVPSEGLLARLRESGLTTGAAITLDFVSPVESKSLGFVVLAFEAGSLALLPCFSAGEARYSKSRVRVRASSALEFSLAVS